MNPAPILHVKGRCHAVVTRTVDPAPERPEQRDPDTGRVTQVGYPARPGYDVEDVTVLTDGGGFVTITYTADALKELGGETPTAGSDVDLPVRSFVRWQKAGVRSFPTVGLSVAADLIVAARSEGRRVQPVATAG